MPRLSRFYLAFALLAPALLSGCGTAPQQQAATPVVAPSAPSAPSTAPSATHQGNVHGGQQPVVGAHIYILAANPTAYGSSSVSLLDPTQPTVFSDANGNYVLTDTNGDFAIAGLYSCSPGQQAYILALGGNPGLPNGATNPAIALMAPLGACPAGQTNYAESVPFVYINEVSTVAAAYSLSGFMTDATHLSSGPSTGAARGLANAFLTNSNLVGINNGVALNQTQTEDGNGETPVAALNTLADMLVNCINSDGTAACSTLFTNAPGPSGTAPANTIEAILNIAHNPGANVAALFGTGFASSPFQPSLTAAPNDWTLAITLYGPTMVGPYFPAIDSIGNLWVPGYVTNTLTEFDTIGNILSGDSGFSGGGLNLPYAIAIDSQDNPWIVNYGPINASTVSKFSLNGTPATTTPYPCSTNCFFPAFDAAQNLWLSGSDRTTVLAPSGSILKQYPTAANDSGIAVNSSGIAWTIGQTRSLYRLGLSATLSTTAESVTASSGTDLTPMAIDSADNVWYVSNKNNAIGVSDKNGTQVSPTNGYTGGGLNGPAQIAIDGSNRAWVANRDGNSLSAFTNDGKAISPSTGYQAASLSNPRGLAIDASGNIWLTNFTYNSITEFVGIATPSATPISPTNHGQRP